MLTGWRHCTLGDILTLQRGFDLPERDRCEGNIPIVSSSGISGYHNVGKVSGPGVVTGRYGTLGKVFYVKENFWPHNTTLYIRDFKENDPLFLSYFLRTLNLAHQNGAGAVPGLNRNALHLLPVCIPPLPMQRTIAAILSAYDDLIENNTRRIAILEEMAQSIYQEWFVRFRFPGHEKNRMVESELGMIPQGWRLVRLEDIADINATSIKRGLEPSEINYIDIASISTGQINKIETIAFLDAPGRARRIVKHGDIIWSTVRPNRKAYSIIINPPANLVVSTGFAVISTREVPYTYLYYTLTTEDFVRYLTNHATGSAYPAVNSTDFQKALVLLPPEDLLSSFHSILADFFEQKQTLFNKISNLRRTRDLLLPKLITGEIDVEEWARESPGREEALSVSKGAASADVRAQEEVEPIDSSSLAWPSLWR